MIMLRKDFCIFSYASKDTRIETGPNNDIFMIQKSEMICIKIT